MRWSQGSMMPSLGVLYLAAVLEHHSIEVEVVPSHVLNLDWHDLARKFETDRPDIIGITTTTENRFQSFELARVAKASSPTSCVVLGGPHCRMTAYDTLAHIPEVDAVVRGEGEMTLLELAQALEANEPLHKVQGLTFRAEGRIIENPDRPLISDLNTLPMPARHLIPWEKYNFTLEVPGQGMQPAGNLITSRGCPFCCTFCATPANWGRNVRGITPENVIKEVDVLVEQYGAKVIWFYDDTFNYNVKRAERICDLLIERPYSIKWYCELRVDLMSRELTEKMAAAGMFGFGIESANERVARDIIKKKATLEQAYRFIDWAQENGIIPNPFFIFSNPTETWDEAQETLAVIDKVKDKCDISVAISHIYPDTELEKRARQEGKIPEDFTWTRERDPRVVVLPAAQGHVPLYIDRLTWTQISQIIFRFAGGGGNKKVSLIRKIPSVLKSIYSFGDLRRYIIMFLVFAKFKLQKVLKNIK
jgi:radical SAM superfamily enzyme YgiQ (UPF0313 family)